VEIVLFHSVLGLRPAVREWADRLRAAVANLPNDLVYVGFSNGNVSAQLLADSGLAAEYDSESAELMLERVLEFLRGRK
jgi:dienelactone hydrolase